MLQVVYTYFNSKTSHICSKTYLLSEVEDGLPKVAAIALEKAGYTLVDVASNSLVSSNEEFITYPEDEVELVGAPIVVERAV